MSQLQIGFLVFPKLTQLDLTGPVQVLSRLPGAQLHLVWKRIEPIESDSALVLTPTTTFADCPPLDVICVPGGAGADDLLTDDETLDFVRRQSASARYATSVCTGSLVLGAAGLLEGYRAACHWSAIDHLAAFGATPDRKRVCIDRNRITGGGVTAGIDFALTLVAEIAGRTVAEMIQLGLEYDPAPPFNAGSPTTASPDIVAAVRERMQRGMERRAAQVALAAAQLHSKTAA